MYAITIKHWDPIPRKNFLLTTFINNSNYALSFKAHERYTPAISNPKGPKNQPLAVSGGCEYLKVAFSLPQLNKRNQSSPCAIGIPIPNPKTSFPQVAGGFCMPDCFTPSQSRPRQSAGPQGADQTRLCHTVRSWSCKAKRKAKRLTCRLRSFSQT